MRVNSEPARGQVTCICSAAPVAELSVVLKSSCFFSTFFFQTAWTSSAEPLLHLIRDASFGRARSFAEQLSLLLLSAVGDVTTVPRSVGAELSLSTRCLFARMHGCAGPAWLQSSSLFALRSFVTSPQSQLVYAWSVRGLHSDSSA